MLVGRLRAGVRLRVTAAALLAVGCALAAAALFVQGNLASDRQRILKATAQQQALEVEALNPQLGAPWQLPPANLQTGLVQVIRDGRVLAFSRPLFRQPPLYQPGDASVQEDNDLFPGQAKDVRIVEVPIRNGSTVVAVVVSMDQYDRSVRYVGRLLAFGMPVLLAVVGLICWAIASRALRPIEALRREVAEVENIPGGFRIAEPATDDEVGRLARTLNRMLDRLEAASAREHRFVSDASHELRSPIANIRTEIEVALHHPEHADWPRVAQDVLGQDERMEELVESLLLLARSDEGLLPIPTTAADLGVVVEAVLRSRPQEASAPRIVVSAGSAPVAVPAVYLEHIVTNLVDNATRFAASQVDVTVESDRQFGNLHVRDDGPGIPEAERTRVFERFVRLDEARDRDHGGFGLGLAIVSDLCAAYGGDIKLEDAAPGAMFTIQFPLSEETVRTGQPARL
jgi:signal transduction histidine kinase